jgi:hypothetical protein
MPAAVTHLWTGPRPGKCCGWPTKTEAMAHARRNSTAPSVCYADFRLGGRGWLALDGLTECCRLVCADGERLSVWHGWDGNAWTLGFAEPITKGNDR